MNERERRAYEDGRLEGQQEERASIVEWLRLEGFDKQTCETLADCIERGDHIKGIQ